jgi:hypothetical protein
VQTKYIGLMFNSPPTGLTNYRLAVGEFEVDELQSKVSQ